MQKEVIILHEDRNVSLTAYLEEVGGEFQNITKRPAILIMPGGGYQICAEKEADPVAFPYLKAGYHVFILRYSLKDDAVWPAPLEDYNEAMSLIVENAEKWNIYPDKIAVIGFSAGGHLAASAAVMGRIRPAAAILGYAVLNEDVKGCCATAPSLIDKVDDQTPPCFLFASRMDDVIPVTNSLEFMMALNKKGILFESHIYAYGPHGFSTGDSSVQDKTTPLCSRIPGWVEDSIGWLKDIWGDFGTDGMTQGVCADPNRAPFLSVDCTLEKLMGNSKAREILEPIISAATKAREGQSEKRESAGTGKEDAGTGRENSGMSAAVQRMTLRTALSYGNVPDEVVKRLNEQLKKIANE